VHDVVRFVFHSGLRVYDILMLLLDAVVGVPATNSNYNLYKKILYDDPLSLFKDNEQ